MVQELSPEQLRRTFDPEALGLQTTEHLRPVTGIIGQPRAVAALQFGLGIHDVGFHIYVSGPPGIGKMTAVRSFLEELARGKETPPDWCYVNNFEDPYQPRVCRLPAGRGRQLQQDMKSLIEHIQREIPRVFESEEYGHKRDDLMKGFNSQRDALAEGLNKRAAQAGFDLQATPMGIMIIPVLGARRLSEAELQALPTQPARTWSGAATCCKRTWGASSSRCASWSEPLKSSCKRWTNRWRSTWSAA